MKKNITSGTIIRTMVLLFALLNQVLTISGKSVLPFSEDQVSEVVSMGITAIAALIAWWKNNSITPEAIAADEYMIFMKTQDEEAE